MVEPKWSYRTDHYDLMDGQKELHLVIETRTEGYRWIIVASPSQFPDVPVNRRSILGNKDYNSFEGALEAGTRAAEHWNPHKELE